MNIIFYDFRDSEKEYLSTHVNDDFNLKLIKDTLNDSTEVSEYDSEETTVISIFTTSRITENVLNKFKNLRLIATRSTGFDHIDIEECAKRNIRVVNVEQYGKTSISEYTIGMMIMLVRNIIPAVRDMRRQDVNASRYVGRALCHLKLGVIGTGAIGGAVCKIAKALGMSVFAFDAVKNSELDTLVDYVEFETLLKNSDVVTLHIPYNKENHHIISSYELSMMKKGSYIINTARGELLDIMAIYDAIASGKLAGCALDVHECEGIVLNTGNNPILNIEKADKSCIQRAVIAQKLAELDKVIMTPHIAYNTKDSVETILETTFSNIRDYFKGFNTNRIV